MKPYIALLMVFGFIFVMSTVQAAGKEYPAIGGFGEVHPLPNAAVQPDKSLKYKVIFDVTKTAEGGKPTPGIVHAAKYLNIMGSAGIPPKDIEAIVVIHGEATPLVLGSTAYREKFQRTNPDHEIILKLSEAGVKLYVCGQTLVEREIDPKLVNERIAVALSAMSTITTYQLKGYSFLPF